MKHPLLILLLTIASSSIFAQTTTADFEARPQAPCIQPFEVTFANLSVNDTSWSWDFGDGITSTLRSPVHRYPNPGVYTVSLAVRGLFGNDLEVKLNYVTVQNPPQAPAVNKTADTLSCGGSTQFIASSGQFQPPNFWYDAQGELLHEGDTLDLPFVSQDADYFVRSERESPSLYVGHYRPDTSVAGVLYSSSQIFSFEVYDDIRIKSFWVDSRSEGSGIIFLEDTLGNRVDSVTVFLPEGRGRVEINLDISPGSYRIYCSSFILNSISRGGTYPYTLPGLLSIKNPGFSSSRFSGFFNWEVAKICKSPEVWVHVETDSISFAGIVEDSIAVSCGSQGSLTAASPQTDSIIWFDLAKNELAHGDSLHLDFPNQSDYFFAQKAAYSPEFQLGPTTDSSLGAGFIEHSAQDAWLFFSVFDKVDIASCMVYTDRARIRHFKVYNDRGMLVQTFSRSIPAGRSRLQLNLSLEKGNYIIGGAGLGLFRNNQANNPYPLSIPGLFSITGSSGGSSFYNCFYDFRVHGACLSEMDSAYVSVSQSTIAPLISPLSAMVPCGNDTVFTSGSSQTYWYNRSGNVVHQGDSFRTEKITRPHTFWASEVVLGLTQNVGPLHSAIGSGNYHSDNAFTYVEFEVYAPVLIKAVRVLSSGTSFRNIELRDNTNRLIQYKRAYIRHGNQPVSLDFELSPGVYRLGGRNLSLYRNTNGAIYPYTVPGLLSLTHSSGGQGYHSFYYNWEVVPVCKSSSTTINVDVAGLVPLPILSQSQLKIDCNDRDSAIASGTRTIRWYNDRDMLIQTGDTFQLPPLIQNTTYYVRNESGDVLRGGAPTNGIGQGSFLNSDQFFMSLDVHKPVKIRSAIVYAGSSGKRTFICKDMNGRILQSTDLQIPAGRSRINLDFDIGPGLGYELGVLGHCDLFRNTQGGTFPYEIGEYMTLNGFRNYYFFYDLEITGEYCASQPVPILVRVTQPLTPIISQPDTLCYGDSLVLQSSEYTGWYAPDSSFLGVGMQHATGPLTQGGNYISRAESIEQLHRTGPAHPDSVGPTTYYGINRDEYVYFTVKKPVRINSLWLNPQFGKFRDIEILDENDNPVAQYSMLLGAGLQKVLLGLKLQPGNYKIGGYNLRLQGNSAGARYPYNAFDLLSITGNTGSAVQYRYFYDWEVQALPCTSPDVIIPVTVLDILMPDFLAYRFDLDVSFYAPYAQQAISWLWDFGDGTTDSIANPTHTYAAYGNYTVTLTVSNGHCDSTISQIVYVDGSWNIDPEDAINFQLFPNPGNGILTVTAEPATASSYQLAVYNVQGKRVLQTAPSSGLRFEKEIDLSEHGAGLYFIHLHVDDVQMSRKYVLIK